MESGEAGAIPVEIGATPVVAGVSQPESACTQQAGGSTPVKPSCPPTSKKPTSRKVSPAWDHFDKVDYPDDRYVAICKYCKRELSAASKNHGTSSLLSHVAGCAKNPNRELRGQKTLSFEPKKEGEKGFDLVTTAFTIEAGRKALAEMIILDELPFTFVENYGFRKFVKVLQPKFKIIPSLKTIAKEVVGLKEHDSSISKVRDAVRWNSTYVMLESAVKFEKVFLRMDFEDEVYNTHFHKQQKSGGLGAPDASDFQDCSFSKLYGSEKATGKIANVRDVLTKLFDYYASIHSPNVEVESVSEKSTMTTDVDMSKTNPYASMDLQYDLYLEAEQSMGCNNKLDKFLAKNCEGRKDVNFDILLLWKTNSSRYQVLSKMVRDVLAVLVSTVASKLAFSTGGRILDPFRSSLSPDMVQVLVCSQNWLKSSVPISLRNAMDEEEDIGARANLDF
uniref:BED-type domain-containing protein n=1 Tax=Fagus sylvatica TaxID=28930 RepID=A0A2N9GWW6_FAGSY